MGVRRVSRAPFPIFRGSLLVYIVLSNKSLELCHTGRLIPFLGSTMREIGPRDLSPVQGDPFWLDGSQG